MRWDLFCGVVDNFGDIGVCWRLARDLAGRGETVRLWTDDASALAWMAPGGCPGVTVGTFDAPGDPGDVVVEAFGCDPPPVFVQAMARQRPLWINLEYLSAEAYVARSHGLPSPQANGLTKWFFYPGFTPATGGLLREPGLLQQRAAFDRQAWLAGLGLALRPGERVVTLFCYDNPAVPALLQALGDQPTLLLLTPGHAQRQVQGQPLPAAVRTAALPWLDQPGFDRLLWAGDINCVRGEDSLVRALWAGAPCIWQIYPQHDGVHAAKLQALLDRLPPVPGLAALWRAWNGLAPAGQPWPAWPEAGAWRAAALAAQAQLAAQPDLVTQLLHFTQVKAAAC